VLKDETMTPERLAHIKPNFDTLGVWTSVKAAEMLDFARC
jgi:hypothetical protein